MKYTIEVDDFYLEDGELEKNLKEEVIRQTMTAIWKQIDKKVEDQIERTVKNEVDNKLALKINAKVADLIATEKILDPDDNRKTEVSITDYIKRRFQKDSGWGTPRNTIEEIAKKFGMELKQRYDTAFATQIVIALEKNQMLKEGAGKLLLTEEKK